MSMGLEAAIKAILKGLVDSGAMTLGQLTPIFEELEATAIGFERAGHADDAAIVREIADFGFGTDYTANEEE